MDEIAPTPTPEVLISTSFLFRYAVPCRAVKELWAARPVPLGEEHKLPALPELDGMQPFAVVRAAWNKQGLRFTVVVSGKRQQPWCRENRLEDSDGLRLWIDTRDTHNIHRAGRFCHQFAFLPTGGGRRVDEPVADQLLINRARENANPIPMGMLKVAAQLRAGGYTLDAVIPANALTGFNPDDHPRLGFMYEVVDRELGNQLFCSGSEFPTREDPSLWATLELV